jgi:hypothetical protein
LGLGGLWDDTDWRVADDACLTACLCHNQCGDSNQVIDDQVEQKVSSDNGNAAGFGLAHRAVLRALAEDAFGHRLGDCDMPEPSCRVVRPSMALGRRLPVEVMASFCAT